MTTRVDARRIARAATLVVSGAALAIGATLGVDLAIAQGTFEHAQSVRLGQSLRLESSTALLDAAVTDAQADVALVDAALQAAPVGYVSAEAAAALADSRTALADTIEQAEAADEALPAPPVAEPASAALHLASEQLLEQAADAEEALGAQAAAIDALGAARAATGDAGAGLLASAYAVASGILPANPSVANQPHLELLRVLDGLGAQQDLDGNAVELLTNYVTAANAVGASHAAEEAEKSGPLYGLRAEVEAYARSIAGGVFLDFNWQPMVIGYNMAGTATIESSPPYFYSTITLTNSIAENWGETTPVSLVTHEVGHAITSKCMDLFNSAFGGDYERWATAWAMSWGYPAGPSGANQYGVPSADQVAIAGTCR